MLAIEHLHEKGITHYDIKHENILLHFPNVKIRTEEDLKQTYKDWSLTTQTVKIGLCDYGFSRTKGQANRKNRLKGTSGLIPPESVNAKENVSEFPHDIYSFGATIF